MSDPSFYNPLLDDDDELSTPAPKVKPKPVIITDTKPSLAKSERRGTPRARATAKDAVLLGFLGKHRVATADTLSMLLKAEAFPGGKASGKTTSIDTTRTRLQKLERLGLVEHDRTWKGELIYGVTPRGKGAAIDYGYLGGVNEAAPVGLKGLNFSMLPHNLAVSSVAARFASELGLSGFGVLPSEALVTEYTLRSAIKPHEMRLGAALKKVTESGAYISNPERYYWADYRAKLIAELFDKYSRVQGVDWTRLLEDTPELFVLGHPKKTTNSFGAQKHFPDLVVSMEHNRTSAKATSIFVEVELTPKSQGGYATVVNTYAEEKGRGVYMGCLYFTNSEAVKRSIIRADKQYKLGLIDSGWLKFANLKNSKGELLKDGKRIGE